MQCFNKKFANLPSRREIARSFIPSLYKDTIQRIICDINQHPVYLILDEKLDAAMRNFLNILIGKFDENPSKPALISAQFLEKTDSGNVSRAVVKCLQETQIEFNNLWLVVTDQAPYMIKCFRMLQTLYLNLHHDTCLAHALHRVCEQIRSDHPLVDEFLGQMKVIFSRSNERITL